MVRRVDHHHFHHRGGGNGEFFVWLTLFALAVMVLRVLIWVALIVVGAWLIYRLWPVIAVVLFVLWKGLMFIGRRLGRLLFRRPDPLPKLLARADPPRFD